MNSTQSKSNKNNFIRNAILTILLAAVVFFLGLYIPAILNDMDKGKPYTMNHVEVLTTIKLTNTSNSVTYDFVAKQNLDNLGIILHFNKLYSDSSIQKLKELYKKTHIVIYDKTNNNLIYDNTIGNNFLNLAAPPGISVWVPHSSSLNMQKNHQYIITIENLPYKTNVSGYDSFILVVGNVEKPWL